MRIRLKNFRCYIDESFDFGDDGLILISGISGSGKSSIMIGINFALFGHGTKLSNNPELPLSVEFEFDGMKIFRGKKPNRLIVNDIHEDEEGQDIINTKFGDTFNNIGYIAQNAANSFILMNPAEKLEFLEKFAFKDIDLLGIKKRCKDCIVEKNNSLISVVSQIEMGIEVLNNLQKPENVKFPIKCKKSDIERVHKNQEIKYKNSTVLDRKTRKEIEKIKTEIVELNNLVNFKEDKNIEISKLNSEFENLEIEKVNIHYSEDELHEYKNRLKNLISEREFLTVKNTYESDIKKLEDMKNNEIKAYTEEYESINIWKDYSKDETLTMITDFENCINSLKLMNGLIKENEKFSNITEEILKEKTEQLENYRVEVEKKKEILFKLGSKSEIYNCPCCHSKLSFKDNNLVIFNNDDLLNDEVNMELLQSEIENLKINIKKLEALIPSIKNKLEIKTSNNDKIKQIIDSYDELPAILETQQDLDYMKKYHTDNLDKERRKKQLENSITNNIFSKSYSSFFNTVQKEKIKLDSIILENDDFIEELTEEELREKIILLNQNNNKISAINNKLIFIEKEIKRYICLIENKNKIYCEKYGTVKESFVLENVLIELETKLTEIEESKIILYEILQNIEKYKRNQELLDNYNIWEEKIKQLKIKENEERNQYSAMLILKEKILEAESVAMSSMISSINTHCQLYLDYFFPENSISVKLVSFKETKKVKKPQINLEIEYKGMECDINMLSGGELARVILAYTLALTEMFNIPLLLLDECTASLDEETTIVIFDGIRENFKGKNVLIIAHQVINGMFDRVINL